MAIHITSAATYNVGPSTAGVAVRGITLQFNTTMTGTATVADGIGTQAIVTNPTVGQPYQWAGLLSPVTVVTSATTDATVSVLNSRDSI